VLVIWSKLFGDTNSVEGKNRKTRQYGSSWADHPAANRVEGMSTAKIVLGSAWYHQVARAGRRQGGGLQSKFMRLKEEFVECGSGAQFSQALFMKIGPGRHPAASSTSSYGSRPGLPVRRRFMRWRLAFIV